MTLRHVFSLGREDGSILPLILGMVALCLALVIGVSDATSLYQERKRLYTLADGAALVGAASFDAAHTISRMNPHPVLSNASVADGVATYLSHVPLAQRYGARVVSALTHDGRTAAVHLQTSWRPPVVSVFFPAGFALDVTARAREVFR